MGSSSSRPAAASEPCCANHAALARGCRPHDLPATSNVLLLCPSCTSACASAQPVPSKTIALLPSQSASVNLKNTKQRSSRAGIAGSRRKHTGQKTKQVKRQLERSGAGGTRGCCCAKFGQLWRHACFLSFSGSGWPCVTSWIAPKPPGCAPPLPLQEWRGGQAAG